MESVLEALVTDNGVRVKTWANPHASNVFNLIFEDIIMENVRNPIIIDQQYCPSANCVEVTSSCPNIYCHICLCFLDGFFLV